MNRTVRACLTVALVAGPAACLGPQVSDEPGLGDQVLPPGTPVPSSDDEAALAARIAEYDGVDGLVPLQTAFAGGQAIHLWDFGPVPSFAAPVYVVVERSPDGPLRVAHNTIIDVAPGDPGYSPYWGVFLLYVTDLYQGEIIPSVAAIDEAVRRGIVEPPERQEFAVNCPAVAADVTVDVGGGLPALPPPSNFYYRGRTVHYYDLGLMPLVNKVNVPEAARYLLRREGGEPLNEVVRGVDMTGDGDTHDTNDVYDLPVGTVDPSPLCRTIEVAVASTVASIDTSGDETVADLRDAAQLFDPDPVAGVVVGYQSTDDLRNCALQRQAGGL